ncbi:MAG: sulfatase-like hydrolase/transferase, partial [Bacteroidales bacterium]|nr:sulfatase-like hydrolase/transferase [Bacteroidales bacterium]
MKNNRNILSELRIAITVIVIVLMFFACKSGTQRSAQKQEKKPNIVFIFADDLNYDMVHALGNPEIITPNLDKLVREGVSITHAYNMGAWTPAVCVSSRGMLNTGRSLWEAHKMVPQEKKLAEEGELWAKMMKKAGYE